MIAEPVTTATDYLLAACALAGSLWLWRSGTVRPPFSRRLWAAAFASLALAALLGGTWHGFSPAISATAASLLWKATLVTGGLASFFLTLGAAVETLLPREARAVAIAAAAKLAVFLAWSAASEGFEPVVADSGIALVAVLAIQLVAWRRRRAPSAPWVAAGMIVSIAAATVEAVRWRMGPLSPDDVYHLVMVFALGLLLRGGLLFARSGETRPAPSGRS